MTAPIDIDCPTCKATSGTSCRSMQWPSFFVDYHHEERSWRARAIARTQALWAERDGVTLG